MELKVGLLGGGSWGTTVASLVSRNAPIKLWARNPETVSDINDNHCNSKYLPGVKLPLAVTATSEIGEAVSGADVLVMGIPSSSFRSVLEEAKQYLRPWVPVISLTKGLELATSKRMTEVIEEVLPGHPVGVLTGPNLAREIMAGQAAASVISMEDEIIVKQLQQLFHSGLFRVYTNTDLLGCELGGVLKNIIAIAGRPETFSGLTGMGDMIATCTSPLSRNRHVGVELGKGRHIDEIIGEMLMVAEGVKSAPTVIALAKKYGVAMPIAEDVFEVTKGNRSAVRAFRGLVNQSAGAESDAG